MFKVENTFEVKVEKDKVENRRGQSGEGVRGQSRKHVQGQKVQCSRSKTRRLEAKVKNVQGQSSKRLEDKVEKVRGQFQRKRFNVQGQSPKRPKRPQLKSPAATGQGRVKARTGRLKKPKFEANFNAKGSMFKVKLEKGQFFFGGSTTAGSVLLKIQVPGHIKN